jgi:hypothetical protein
VTNPNAKLRILMDLATNAKKDITVSKMEHVLKLIQTVPQSYFPPENAFSVSKAIAQEPIQRENV